MASEDSIDNKEKKLNEEKHKDIKLDEGKDSNTRDKTIADDKSKIEQDRKQFVEKEQQSKGYQNSNANDADMIHSTKDKSDEIADMVFSKLDAKYGKIHESIKKALDNKKDKTTSDIIDDAWDRQGN